MNSIEGFYCARCGEYHQGIPMSFGFEAPAYWSSDPGEQDGEANVLTEDLCIIDNQYFFILGALEIPVLDAPEPFVWGVWVSLSEKNFQRTVDLWKVEGREQEPPNFGWLSSSLPGYPETLNLKTNVHTRP